LALTVLGHLRFSVIVKIDKDVPKHNKFLNSRKVMLYEFSPTALPAGGSWLMPYTSASCSKEGMTNI